MLQLSYRDYELAKQRRMERLSFFIGVLTGIAVGIAVGVFFMSAYYT